MDSAAPRPIRILLFEDHGIVRAGSRLLIETSPGQPVVGEAAGRDHALALAAHTQPDIILLDVYLGADSSLNWLPELRAAAPQARVLLLTALSDRAEHRRAVRLGERQAAPRVSDLAGVVASTTGKIEIEGLGEML